MAKEITLPHRFHYRDYQKEPLKFIRAGGKRGVCLYHRRWGKDKTFFNIVVEQALRVVGGYAYVFPTYAQGKKVIWDSIDKDGMRFIDHIPPELVDSMNSQELKITLKNGSFIQVLGSENIDGLRGISPKGIVFSEYAFQNPTAWAVMRPILAENGGWAMFNSTPNGKNHFFDLWNSALENEKWFTQKLSVDDTWMVSSEYIDEERRMGMSEDMVQQEYYVSFDVGAQGAYYATQLNNAVEEGRIAPLPFNRDVPVDLFLDLWVNDSFTISFVQKDGNFYNFVNYHEDNWKPLDYYFSIIDDWFLSRKAKLGIVYLPHDSKQRSHGFLVAGITVFDKFAQKYPQVRKIENNLTVNDGIQEVRRLFPRVRIDSETCIQLIRCLENYKKEWDDKRKVFRDTPSHDWASHGADSFRYFAISGVANEKYKKKTKIYTPSYRWVTKK